MPLKWVRPSFPRVPCGPGICDEKIGWYHFELSPKEFRTNLALPHACFCLHFLGVGRDVPFLLWEFWATPISSRAEMRLLADCHELHIAILITAWGPLNSESLWARRQPPISPTPCRELSDCPLGLAQESWTYRSDRWRPYDTDQVWEEVTLDWDIWNGLVIWTPQCSGLSILSGS